MKSLKRKKRNKIATDYNITPEEREFIKEFIYPLYGKEILERGRLRKLLEHFFNVDTRDVVFYKMNRAIEVPCTYLNEGGKPLSTANNSVKLYKKNYLLVTTDLKQPYVRASILSEKGDTVFRLSKAAFKLVAENAKRLSNE